MVGNADLRLDILIKQEEDYFLAHCLQFDLVVTADTLEEVKKDIIEVCSEHIRFSLENNNAEYLFSPAPKDVWTEYLTMTLKEDCDVNSQSLKNIPCSLPFMVQEVICHAAKISSLQ
jgi:hypothetical protein